MRTRRPAADTPKTSTPRSASGASLAETSSANPRATLVPLTPEATAALGGHDVALREAPFRVGRESRGPRNAAGRTIAERRKGAHRPTNDLYLPDRSDPTNVSREHFQIQHNGTSYVLIDRQSVCGTIVEGAEVGGRGRGGAVPLKDGDVIIVGTSSSPYIFKFRVR
jgi:pSer/pThr/pTyr-binding forkhead associated (FHA) protein